MWWESKPYTFNVTVVIFLRYVGGRYRYLQTIVLLILVLPQKKYWERSFYFYKKINSNSSTYESVSSFFVIIFGNDKHQNYAQINNSLLVYIFKIPHILRKHIPAFSSPLNTRQIKFIPRVPHCINLRGLYRSHSGSR